ncbi:hypothetical protein AY599_18590 [Leptolyngbya valderiana BDU 20041]|nr:hypothetical protein AY599_18590 [Leptolyngbya valderiana BDU 20041]
MLDRRRSVSAILMAASVLALPTSILAAQDAEKTTTRNSLQRDARASQERLEAARTADPRFYLTGPSRHALTSKRTHVQASGLRRQYTEEELREIRAARLRLIRDMGAGPSSNPRGVILSHPTLGRITISTSGPIAPPPGTTEPGSFVRPTPGMLAGPSATAGTLSSDPEPGSGGGGGGSAGDFPVLRPGSGFAGATPQPAPVGNPSLPGYDAQAIARWDVVPYQDFEGQFHIGVVAFHMNGIDRVEFSLNGGPWEAVREMKLNPRTGVWEYTAIVDAATLDDGLVEIRARAFPRYAGEVRVLGGQIDGHNDGSIAFRNGIHSMFLNANAGGTLPRHEVYADAENGSDETGDGSRDNPFRSHVRALAEVTLQHGSSEGAVCYLLPGDYVWEGISHPHTIDTSTRWATVTPAPGVDADQVRFVGNEPAGLRTRLIRAHNITMTGEGTPRTFTSMDTYFWLSNSTLMGDSRFEGGGLASGSNDWAGIYGTDIRAIEVRSPFRSSTFVRNVQASGFSDTPFGADTLVINGDVRDFTRNPDGTHADVFHWFWRDDQERENRLIYNLRVYEFPLLGFLMNPIRGGEQELEDIAIVNVHISKDQDSVGSSMWNFDVNHLVISGLQLPDQTFRFDVHRQDDDGELTIKNLAVTNSIFAKITGNALPEDGRFRNIHVIDGNSHMAWVPPGVNITDGDVHGGDSREDIFVSPRSKNYQPRPSSIVWGRFPASDLMAPADVLGRPARGDMVPLGAYFGG